MWLDYYAMNLEIVVRVMYLYQEAYPYVKY